MNRSLIPLLALFLLQAPIPALADPIVPANLAPGQSVAVPDFDATGTLIATQTVDFGDGTGPTGSLREFVLNGATSSPFGLAGNVFAFSVSLTSDNIVGITLSGYAGFETAVKSCNDPSCIEGIGEPPDTASRTANGDNITFLFGPPLSGGSSGFSVYTNATGFTDPDISIFDTAGNMVSVASFAPSVPEPSTWVLTILGFGAVGLVLRRREKFVVNSLIAHVA